MADDIEFDDKFFRRAQEHVLIEFSRLAAECDIEMARAAQADAWVATRFPALAADDGAGRLPERLDAQGDTDLAIRFTPEAEGGRLRLDIWAIGFESISAVAGARGGLTAGDGVVDAALKFNDRGEATVHVPDTEEVRAAITQDLTLHVAADPDA